MYWTPSRSDSGRDTFMVGWLAGWLADWLAGWLADWLAGWLADIITVKFRGYQGASKYYDLYSSPDRDILKI